MCVLTEGDEDGGIPAEIFELSNLRTLELQYQAIRFVPEAIGQLRQLTSLMLRHCPLLGESHNLFKNHTVFLRKIQSL